MKAWVVAVALLVPFVPSAAAEDGPGEGEHADVFVPPLMGCTWTGSYKPYVSTPLVTVWVYSCDPET